MQIADVPRAERKLRQVGYYRLSGFWYPCREFLRDASGNVMLCTVSKKPLRQDSFASGTQFTASKYYEILKDSHRNRICKRFGLTHTKILKEWLREINTLRNRCAHHSRIWNQVPANPLPTIPNDRYFERLSLDSNATSRLYGLIAIIWYLVKTIGANSNGYSRLQTSSTPSLWCRAVHLHRWVCLMKQDSPGRCLGSDYALCSLMGPIAPFPTHQKPQTPDFL
ncbi:Abi family protein [Pseudomonas marvdashtae]|uniref:Abi family protein n=1 Tax=Pseudomonas marvdashtae TaxID=2745500 RepID=UPI001CEC2695|nr:Abi family protein [Pseudomonas marvdashtae]